jgi:hypothetical protein
MLTKLYSYKRSKWNQLKKLSYLLQV